MSESIEEMKANLEKSELERLAMQPYPNCGMKCGKCYLASPDYQIENGVTCEDRYFEEFGKEIDEHPIGVPHKYIKGA